MEGKPEDGSNSMYLGRQIRNKTAGTDLMMYPESHFFYIWLGLYSYAINPKMFFWGELLPTIYLRPEDGGASGDKARSQTAHFWKCKNGDIPLKKRMCAPQKKEFPTEKVGFPTNKIWDVLLKIWIFPPPKLHSFQSSTNGVRNDHQGFQPDRPMGPTGPQKWRTTLSPVQLTEQYIYIYMYIYMYIYINVI